MDRQIPGRPATATPDAERGHASGTNDPRSRFFGDSLSPAHPSLRGRTALPQAALQGSRPAQLPLCTAGSRIARAPQRVTRLSLPLIDAIERLSPIRYLIYAYITGHE